MKKSLVLAMAMALGVTASAYAANPFSDVPAGHWAYDSVNKLAAAGIVDGYGNGTFGGDRLMTRYEMAQIVAKAMAKGANVDRQLNLLTSWTALAYALQLWRKNLITLESLVRYVMTTLIIPAISTVIVPNCVPVFPSTVKSMTTGNMLVCCKMTRI